MKPKITFLTPAESSYLSTWLSTRIVGNVAGLNPSAVFFGQNQGRGPCRSLPPEHLYTGLPRVDERLPPEKRFITPCIATVLDGHLISMIDGVCHEARQGDWIISPFGVPRREFFIPSSPHYHLFWFSPTTHYAMGETRYSLEDGLVLNLYETSEKPAGDRPNPMLDVLADPAQPLDKMRANLLRVVVWWLDRLNEALETTTVRGHPLVDAIQAAIDHSDVRHLSVGSLAHQFGISRFHLSRIYHRYSGRTIHRSIQEARIECARKHLVDTSQAVKEISYLVGYRHPQHFTRAFRQVVGLSPQVYRMHACPPDEAICGVGSRARPQTGR